MRLDSVGSVRRFFVSTPPCITYPIFNATAFPERCFGASSPNPWRDGATPLRHYGDDFAAPHSRRFFSGYSF